MLCGVTNEDCRKLSEVVVLIVVDNNREDGGALPTKIVRLYLVSLNYEMHC